jgi:hypothetical protein
MRHLRQHNPIAIALYVNAAILLAILWKLSSAPNSNIAGTSSIPSILPAAMAQNQPPIAGGAGVFVMPGQLSTQTWGCYLLDVDSQTLCVYQYFPDKTIRLVAARNFRYDRQLKQFNTDPSPQAIRELLEKGQPVEAPKE